MECWWSVEEIPALLDHLRARLLDEAGPHGRDLVVVDAVLTLALKGKVEIGECDGVLVLRESRLSHGHTGILT